MLQAWHWCKNRTVKSEHKDRCDRQIVSACSAIICEGCSIGISVDEIKQVINSEAVQQALKNRNALWSGNVKTIEEFLENPKRIHLKLRITSMPRRLMRQMYYTPFFRRIALIVRYKTNMREYRYTYSE